MRRMIFGLRMLCGPRCSARGRRARQFNGCSPRHFAIRSLPRRAEWTDMDGELDRA